MRKKILIITMITVLVMCFSPLSFATSTQDKLNSVSNQKDDISSDLDSLASEIKTQQAAIDKLQSSIDSKTAEIAKAQSELAKTKKEIIERKAGLEQRLRAMYKNGSVGYVDIILSSKNVSELVSNIEMVQRIFKSDQNTLSTLKEQKAQIETIQAKLTSEKKVLDEKQSKLNTKKQSMENKNVKGLIIDIRENGGGYTDQGIEIADMLLPEGTITYMEDRNGKKTYYNSKEGRTKLKYVLLVDGNTASTSEILASAIKDNKGGAIVGTTTYGKGIVQEEKTFKDGSAFKLTIYQYFSPKGNKIHKIGVKPDYQVKLKEGATTDYQLQKALQLLK